MKTEVQGLRMKTRTHTLSFEMMPPRKPPLSEKFWEAAEDLVALRPDFISITYGAGGVDRKTSLETLERLVYETPILPIAHLTCIETPKSEVAEVAEDFLNAGVRMFLALRGDPPKAHKNMPEALPQTHASTLSNVSNAGSVSNAGNVSNVSNAGASDRELAGSEFVRDAVELTYLLRQLDKKRQRASDVNRFRAIARPLIICVAAFPGGNPELGTSPAQEVGRLLEKQDAGADFAITQIYYDAKVYDDFIELAHARGVNIPILAGVLPTFSAKRLLSTERNIKVKAPQDLLAKLESASGEAEKQEIALDFFYLLSKRAIDSGSPGIHMFTFNNSLAPIKLADRLGMVL
jgi:methylenetetrahydrofolate reductase (NADPH)